MNQKNNTCVGVEAGEYLTTGTHNIWIGLRAGNPDKQLHWTIAIGTDARPEKDYEFVMRTNKGDFIRYDMSEPQAESMNKYFLNLIEGLIGSQKNES